MVRLSASSGTSFPRWEIWGWSCLIWHGSRPLFCFFSRLAWALFGVSVVVSCFQFGIMYVSGGRGNLQQTALSIIKGFLAVSLFTIAPVRLYALSVSLQGTFSAGITGYGTSIGEVGQEIVEELSEIDTLSEMLKQLLFRIGRADKLLHDPVLYHSDDIRSSKGVFCKPEAGRHSADPDCSGKPLYVFHPTRLHRWLCAVDQAGHRALSDCVPTIHHPGSRTDGV